MSPSSTLQDRIRQFESMNGSAIKPLQAVTQQNGRTRPSYPPVPRVQTTFHNPRITTSPNDIMNAPISPTASSFIAIKPSVPYVPRKPKIKSPSPSPPNLGCKTSLIDLGESSLDERAEWLKITRPPIAPPLPPRMSSQSSGASASSSSRSLSSQFSTPSIQSRSSSNSLTVEHTYPPLMKSASHSNLRRQGHVSASSTSSFHSVSLSSDGDAATDGTATGADSSVLSTANRTHGTSKELERDRDDTLSFETVSSADMGSPTPSLTHEWEKDFSIHKSKIEPPKLPSRRTPVASPSPSGSTMTSPLTSPPLPLSQKLSPPLNAVRRVPPPPPSRVTKPPPASASSRASVMSTATSSSDRSSIFSAGTVTTTHTSIASCTQLLRPTPVPMAARKRYESVFFANVNAQRRATLKKLSPSAAVSPPDSHPASPRKGWRGVSVDLVTNPEDNPIVSTLDDEVEGNRLDGRIVKAIWSRSKLSPGKLRDVWNACALPDQNSLEKDGFVKGMWQIDEELKRVQALHKSTVTTTKISSKKYVSK